MAVSVTSIANIEAALGKDLTGTDETRATYYINVISAFMASYCDLISFSEVADDAIRVQADFYGILDLGGGPISEVASVTSVDGTIVSGWTFDGMSRILGLNPFQTVIVTHTHGVDDIPEDLESVATEAVIGLLALKVSGPVTTRTVGDVTYVYQQGQTLGFTLPQLILDKYRTTEYTMRLGSSYARGLDYPPNWFQISG